METEKVNAVPYDINGDKKCSSSSKNKFQSSHDGRQWSRKNKIFRKEFKKEDGSRYRANCVDSKECTNLKCPFLVMYKRRNKNHVDSKNCYTHCKTEMKNIPCNAVKIWEFLKERPETVIVYHCGTHTCAPVYRADLPKESLQQKKIIEKS